MVQTQPKVLFKTWLALLLLLAMSPNYSFGQLATIGSTSGTSHFVYGPYYRSNATSSFNYSRYAYLYTASELGIPAGATITKVEWMKASGSISGNNTFNVWLGNVSANTLTDNTTWDSLVNGATQVYASTTHSFTAMSNSWEAVNITPFVYNGGNLKVLTDFVKNGTASGPNNFYVNAATGKALGWATNSPIAGNTGLTTSSYGNNRPTIRITYTPAANCVGTPTAGGAISSATGSVCVGTTVQLTLAGNSVGGGQTYQWQESASASGPWSNIGSSSTVAATTISATSTKYYRAEVTCNGNTAASTPVQISVNTPFAGGTYTINPGAPASSTNFQTFTAFANALGCAIGGPVTVNVTAGTYNEQLTLGEIGGVSSTNTITINGNGAVISNVSVTNSNRGVITLNGTDWVTINNLTISASSALNTSYGWGVFMTNNADNNTISNCTINLNTTTASSNYAGIVVSGSGMSATATGSNSDNITITNNTINGGFYGISVVGSGNSVISNNTVKDFYLYGIYGGALSGATIEGNNIHRMTRSQNINSFYGIWLYNNNSSVTVSKNMIHDPATLVPTASLTFYGIGLNGSTGSGNVISNNIMYNLQGNGDQYMMYHNGSIANWINNTVNSDYPASNNASHTTWGFYQAVSAGSNTFQVSNNNISITRAGTRIAMEFANAQTGMIASYNNLYTATPGVVGRRNGTNYTTAATWNTAMLASGNISENPFFVNASAGNLAPTSYLLDNAGTSTSVTTDINGAVRNNPPDIGAYEFSVATCSGTPAAGTVTAPSSACAATTFGLSFTGFSTGAGISYQWESAPANTNNWTPIGQATSNYLVTTQASATKYRVVTTCAGSGLSMNSNEVTVSMNAATTCYCASYATGSADGEITQFSFGTLSQASTCLTTGAAGSMQSLYSDYTAVTPANVTRGNRVPFTIGVGTCGNPMTGYAKIYIDYNQNGDFSDSGEEAYVSSSFVSAPGATISGTITIPVGATLGNTRLRVVMVETTNAAGVTPCGAYGYGETEDYTITISGNTGNPANVVFNTIGSNSFKFNVTRATGNTGTLIVVSEGAPLAYDPINTVNYTALSTKTGYINTTAVDSVANGKAMFIYLSGSSAQTSPFTISKLKSGVTYYVYAYPYTQLQNGRIYNTLSASINATTTLVAPSGSQKSKNIKVEATSITANSMMVKWVNGGGAGRIVVAAKTALSGTNPTDNTTYDGNAAFGNGDAIATGDYVVANIDGFGEGEADSLVITNLEAGTKYQIAIWEYNGGQTPTEPIMFGPISSKATGTTSVDFVSISKTGIGVVHSQDFDTVSTTTNALPLGWHASGSVAADNGSSSTEGVKNYGSTGNSDRALGSLGSNSFGVKLVNKTKPTDLSPWTSILVRYTGEQWRNGDASSDNIKVQYSLDAYTLNDANQYMSNSAATWTDASTNLTFTSPNTAGNGAIDGNASGNKTQHMASIVATVAEGSAIWIRWVDASGTSADGLAIDNVEIIPFGTTLMNGDVASATSYNNGLNVVGAASATTTNVKKAFNIESGATLDMSAGANKLTISGKLYGTGNISMNSDDQVVVGGTDNQTMYFTPGTNTIQKLTVNKGSTATLGNALNIDDNGSVKIGGSSTPNGTLYTNGNLTLKASTADAAFIEKMPAGVIVGDVTVEAGLSAPASVRLLGHPFSSAIPVSQINDDVALNLTGGSGQNLWYYDPTTSATGANTTTNLQSTSIWEGFDNLTDNWNSYTGVRLFKPQGEVTIDLTGAVNQGNVSFSTATGASGLVVVSNPYPSPARINNPPSGLNTIYYWNPSLNNSTGGWVTKIGSAMKITVPMCGAFVAKGNPNSTLNWSFTENDKSTSGSVAAAFFRGEGEDVPVGLILTLANGKGEIDELGVYFDKNATASVEAANDGVKMDNPGTEFYTNSAEGTKLAVDTRPYAEGSSIPVGLTRINDGRYTISVSDWNLNDEVVYLMDTYTGNRVALDEDTKYTFSVNGSNEGRFYLQLGKKAQISKVLSLELAPNPASESVNIRVNGAADAKVGVRVLSMTGAVMIETEMSSAANQLTVPVTNLATGVYLVEVNVDGQKITRQLVKQ